MATSEQKDIAQKAWNSTREKEDPAFVDCAFDHQSKLVNIVEDASRDPTHDSGHLGLEKFNAKVRELLTPKVETKKAGK